MKFDIKQTNVVKGLAVLLLLWHHLFLNNLSLCTPLLTVHGIAVAKILADCSKCCVALFVFLSGYGLFKSYSSFIKRCPEKRPAVLLDFIFIKNRVLKLLKNYWFVFFIFVPLSLLFGRYFYKIYGSNPLHYIADVSGISYLLYGDKYTMNPTWWYIGMILVYYIVYPFICRLYMRFPKTVLIISILSIFIPNVYRNLNIYFPTMMFGTLFADKKVFECADSLNLPIQLKTIIAAFVLILLLPVRVLLNQRNMVYSMKFDIVFILPIVFICYFAFSRIKILNAVLEELGKKSGLIFLFHTFIFSFFFKDLLYSLKYPLLIFIVLTSVCYVIASLLEKAMELTKYNRLFSLITHQGGNK